MIIIGFTKIRKFNNIDETLYEIFKKRSFLLGMTNDSDHLRCSNQTVKLDVSFFTLRLRDSSTQHKGFTVHTLRPKVESRETGTLMNKNRTVVYGGVDWFTRCR